MLPRSIRHTFKPLFAASIIAVSALVTLTVLLDSSAAQAHRVAPLPADVPATIADVSVVDFAFEPDVVTITVGSTVRWTRSSNTFTHTTTSDMNVWDSGPLAADVPFMHTFDMPGIYLYHCAIHPFMQGVVMVINSPSQPPTNVTINGPVVGEVDTPYAFTAAVKPITAAQPITYFWQATGQSSVTHVSTGLSDTIIFSWTSGMTGAKWITTTATNAAGSASGTHLILINPIKVFLPLLVKH